MLNEVDQNENNKPSNRSSALTKGISIIVGTVVAFYASQALIKYFSNRKPSDAELNKIASELNKSLPMMLDRDTQLKTTVGINSTIKYVYVLVNFGINEIDTASLKAYAINQSTAMSCSNKDSRALLDREINMEYVYHDKNDVYAFSHVLTKEKCENFDKTKR